jgi:hypothetical protein
MDFAKNVLFAVSENQPSDFAGLGVVFYDYLEALPLIALDSSQTAESLTPVDGMQAIAATLASASSRSSGCHDGFHLVDLKTERLTHLAQFLSPPIPPKSDLTVRASGARHMTALLATRVRGVVAIGILGTSDEVTLYANGSIVFRSPSP